MGDKALPNKKRDSEDAHERLRERARAGTANLVEQVLRQPEVQRTLMRQSIETAVFVSCLLVGVLTMVNAAKQALNVSWQIDLALGVSLILVFLVYVVKKMTR